MNVTKSFSDYVKDNEREYHYRLKTVQPIEEDKDLDFLERVLKKYVLKDISKPSKTIMQKHPLDFPDIQNAEVWIVDFTTALPASPYVLQQEIKLALNMPEKFIVVRGDNDPLEVYTQQIVAAEEADMAATEQGLEKASRLSTNRHYDEDEQTPEDADPLYGDEYNSEFLQTLAKVAASREAEITGLDSEELNQGGDIADDEEPADDNAFNDHIEDSPKVEPADKYTEMLNDIRKKDTTDKPSRLSIQSNYDDDEVKVSKKYAEYGDSEKVATVTISNEREGIRKS